MAGKFRRERTCEHMFIRREIFLGFDLQMKIEKREILVYSTIPLNSRFQRSYFGEYYEFEDVKHR